MIGVEFNFVVPNVWAALKEYQSIFPVEVIEITDFPTGLNEGVFTIFNTRFHMLEANKDFELFAPEENVRASGWFNVTVENIAETLEKARRAGCKILQDITPMEKYGVSNAYFLDSSGYYWMLHEVHKVVDFETRIQLWKEEFGL